MSDESNDIWELDDHICPCHGSGWAETSNELWHECPIHFNGQLHPLERMLLLDEPNRLAEEERKARLKFQIRECNLSIGEYQTKLLAEQEKLFQFQLELINKTPTVRAMKAVAMPPPIPTALHEEVIELSDGDFI